MSRYMSRSPLLMGMLTATLSLSGLALLQTVREGRWRGLAPQQSAKRCWDLVARAACRNLGPCRSKGCLFRL